MPDMTVIGHPQSSIVYDDFETMLRRVQLYDIPINAGWDELKFGSGATTVAAPKPRWATVTTGTTANSWALLSMNAWGVSQAKTYNLFNFDKRTIICADLVRIGSNHSEAVRRFQLKAGSTPADLAALGLSVKVIDATIWGESYGTEQGLVNLSTVMGANTVYRIITVLTPGVRIDWYINGVHCGSQSTAAKIPTGLLSLPKIVYSAANGASGGVDSMLACSGIQIGQEN